MKADNITALVCLTAICIVGAYLKVEGIKEIMIGVCGAIGGWMARGKETHD